LIIRKTREELRPNRLAHRAAEFLEDIEREHFPQSPKAVHKDLRGKVVSLEGLGRVGASVAGHWRWFPAIQARHSAQLLALGEDWVNGE
jgi:lactate dehydrogenase-like 2-hydroxyacid dehydrogenase